MKYKILDTIMWGIICLGIFIVIGGMMFILGLAGCWLFCPFYKIELISAIIAVSLFVFKVIKIWKKPEQNQSPIQNN